MGEPQRAFYGNQFGNTFPIFAHYGVPLWVPEVGGPIDPDNEAHDLIMSVFGGVSKGERNRIKIRVRTAMAAQAQLEGRFLGGRPPYGYQLIDAGPHPNPAKAADGKRLHALAIDEPAAAVVERIFAEFLAGHGHLRHRRAPDPRRHPVPVRARPGPQPAPLRHRLVQERRPRHPHQPPLHRPPGLEPAAQGRGPDRRPRRRPRPHDQDAVERPGQVDLLRARSSTRRSSTTTPSPQAQAAPGRPRRSAGQHKPHRSQHAYALRGLLFCGICDRRMQGHWANAAPYYRCRFPSEYALANKRRPPAERHLRQDALLAPLDDWLASKFDPRTCQAPSTS